MLTIMLFCWSAAIYDDEKQASIILMALGLISLIGCLVCYAVIKKKDY